MPHIAYGYHGRYLRIDVGSGSGRPIELDPAVLRSFIGGVGLGAWLLLQESEDGRDALAPEAPLAFVFSPLVGSPLTTSAKFAVVAKSPLTERLNDSLCSSGFALAGKRTGFDALVIVGQAPQLSVLVVEPDGVRLLPTPELAGQSISQTSRWLRTRLGADLRTAVIGPAGETGCRFATISHDARHAGRGGLGAVLGSKRIKAVAVRGDRTVSFAHVRELAEYARRLSRASFGPATEKYRELGTLSNLLVFNRLGVLPTRNFRSGTFPEAQRFAPEALAQAHPKVRASCAACTIGCEHIYKRKDDQPGRSGVRLEYENLFALGPLCGISDPETVLQASSLCDELGMDTISAGATIAFAMECAERGLIDRPAWRFGNGQALLSLLREMAAGTGDGALLAQGTRAAARQIGRGAEQFACHVKGLEIPGYDPRALQSMALGFAVGTRGADHNRSGAYQLDFSSSYDRLDAGPEVVPAAVELENEAAIMDSLILCKFLRGVFDDRMNEMARMLQLVTGWEVDTDELAETAERIVTARKWFNIRHGWQPDEDTLPPRFFTDELPDGASAGAVLTRSRLAELVCLYNRTRGWTAEGWIPEERLEALGLLPAPSAQSG